MADAPKAEDYGPGTYDVPGLGLVVNGVLVDSPAAAKEAGWGRTVADEKRKKAKPASGAPVVAKAPEAAKPMPPVATKDNPHGGVDAVQEA